MIELVGGIVIQKEIRVFLFSRETTLCSAKPRIKAERQRETGFMGRSRDQETQRQIYCTYETRKTRHFGDGKS